MVPMLPMVPMHMLARCGAYGASAPMPITILVNAYAYGAYVAHGAYGAHGTYPCAFNCIPIAATLCFTTPCYAMLECSSLPQYAMPHYAKQCCAMLTIIIHIMLCCTYVLLFHAILCYTMLCCTMLTYTLLYDIVLYHAVLCSIMLRYMMLILPCAMMRCASNFRCTTSGVASDVLRRKRLHVLYLRGVNIYAR